jgi:ClpP class serine protease
MTPEERAVLQVVLDDMHDQFVTAIAEGRRLSKERVRSLADGRIYSGRMAKELGLVDALGGLDEAVRIAGELGGVPGKPRLVRPRRPWRLLDLADLVGGESALSWLRSVSRSGPAVPTLPLLGSSKLPLYLLD